MATVERVVLFQSVLYWKFHCFSLATPTIRAQKEAEATNGGTGGDTPPEDEVGGAEDEILADGETETRGDDTNEDSPEDSISSGRKGPRPPNLPPLKSDGVKECEPRPPAASESAMGLSQVAKNAESAPSRGRGEKSESRSAKSSVESAPDSHLPSSPMSASNSSHSQRDHAPSTSTTPTTTNALPPERQTRRSKAKDRAEKVPESASMVASSRGNRQGVLGGSGRTRVHGSRSSTSSVGGGGEVQAQPNLIPPVPSVNSSTSASIGRLSSPGMGGGVASPVVSVANSVTTPTSSPRKGRKEDGWKEVGRR